MNHVTLVYSDWCEWKYGGSTGGEGVIVPIGVSGSEVDMWEMWENGEFSLRMWEKKGKRVHYNGFEGDK